MARPPAVLLPAALAVAAALHAPPAQADAQALRQRHAQLEPALRSNVFGRPLQIASSESSDQLQGQVSAVLDHPFEMVQGALREPGGWCDILILPFNTKYCRAVRADAGTALLVRIGRKHDQPVEQAFRLQFAWQPVAASADYFETRLAAPGGPLGTRDLRISVAAVPLDGGRTFMELRYAYGYGLAGRLAMHAYLSTVGADKVGFTATGRGARGEPVLIGGFRGAVERNAMRYYLAIDAYLDSLSQPAGRQAEWRINAWFDATERHARQLREMDKATYLAMKRQELERQQVVLLR